MAIARVPPGRWGVGVSGGADSVALLMALLEAGRARDLVVLHVDHHTRGGASAGDARFVEQLATDESLPCRVLSADPTARGEGAWRRERMRLFTEAAGDLSGVLLAHHADDVAETLALRLLRGSPRSATMGLAPLRFDRVVVGLRVVRPLLNVQRATLRAFLAQPGIAWREDASNAQPVTPRNVLRAALADRPEATAALLDLAEAAAGAEAALDAVTPVLPEEPTLSALASLAEPLQRRAGRRWLVARGVPEAAASPGAVDRLLALADAAGPRACDFAGGVRVNRRGGRLVASRPHPGAAPRSPACGSPSAGPR